MARRARLESGSSRGGVAGNDGRCSGFITRERRAVRVGRMSRHRRRRWGRSRARGDGARVARGGSSDVRARRVEALRRRDACARPRVGATSARPPWSPSLDTRFGEAKTHVRRARRPTATCRCARCRPSRVGAVRRSIRGLRFSTNRVKANLTTRDGVIFTSQDSSFGLDAYVSARAAQRTRKRGRAGWRSASLFAP